MTPDPVLDMLARLTPNGSRLDPAEVLVRAGRASARTPWGWKLAVAGLLLANAVTVALLLPRRDPSRPPDATPSPVVTPAASSPPPVPESPPSPEPNSIAALAHSFDPDRPPPPAGFAAPDRPAAILTVSSRDVTD
jgi:hypothetical protein